jgi:molybdopterin synthase catalytic subunit
MSVYIKVQEQDFNLEQEYQQLCQDAPKIGAIVTFSGLVREFDNGHGDGLVLEHYPQMTEKVLVDIVDKAKEQWPIISCRIIHRIGKLNLGDQIVFVGVNSAHREAAFDACRFIMDFLKTQAPFWKKALSQKGDHWVEAKTKDFDKQQRWLQDKK